MDIPPHRRHLAPKEVVTYAYWLGMSHTLRCGALDSAARVAEAIVPGKKMRYSEAARVVTERHLML